MRLYTAISCLALGACLLVQTYAQSTVLFSTEFERAEGYDPNSDLAGQRGWLMEGSGGNGLQNFFEGFGQQAYIGFQPPAAGTVTAVWRPVNFNPVPAGNPIVHFSVMMQVVQSTTGGDDDFRWAVYNTTGNRLFGINFETATQEIWFQNEDLDFRSTGLSFNFEGTYDLHIWMDFARNSWTAMLNNIVLANAQPITTTNTPRNLGDVDAVWFINNPAGTGNNYMVFDNYRITVENLKAIPAILEPIGMTPERYYRFMVHGQPNVRYSVEVTDDLRFPFESLGETSDPDGTFIFEDTTAPDYRRGFYRVRELIP
ncbi:MAG TPA: hypothetical protein VF773_22695 [Verrucomicrobiae bacterium]